MARFVNESGSVLTSWEHGWKVGPNDELDWPDYDPETHGATPGLRRVDESTPAKPRRGANSSGSIDETGDSGTAAQAGDTSTDENKAADAAGEENPR